MQIKCSVCGAENPEDAKFCRKCGKQFEKATEVQLNISSADIPQRKCDKCGAAIVDGTKFCRKCGAEIAAGERKEETSKPEIPHDGEPAEVKKEQSSNDISQSQNHVSDANSVCPYCGAKGCQMVQRNSTKVTQSGYGCGSGCCGLILLGPFGLLCGLCGSGSKVDIKNEIWFMCPSCGKQHISYADAANKTRAMALSAFLITLVGAAFISCSVWLRSFSWITAAAVIIPIISWGSLYFTVKDELGKSPKILFTDEQLKKYLIIFVISVIVVLIFGWRIFALASQ